MVMLRSYLVHIRSRLGFILILTLVQSYAPAQIFPFRAGEPVGLFGVDTQLAPVAAGSAATLLTVTADPSIGGGDLFDIFLQNSQLAVSLILPGGVEVTSSNASSLGFGYAAYQVPSSNRLQEIIFARAGAHVVITLPASQAPGT